MGTPREQLAAMLKKARLGAGYDTHGALAKALTVTRSVVSKAENPRMPVPSEDLLTRWAGATGESLDKLTDLARRAKSGTPEWFVQYRLAEAEATTVRCWGPLIVPGLLQTGRYVREVLKLSVEPYTPEKTDELLAVRLERQEVLGRAHVSAVIEHTVLDRCLGSAEIMAEQCAHLATLAEQPRTRVYIVPDGANVGLDGAFNLAARDGNVTVNLTSVRDVSSTDSGLADECMRTFEQLLASSMDQARSLDFIRQAEDRWKERA